MSSSVKNSERKSVILSILNGTIVAISVTLVLILLFALLIRFCNISDNWIFPINQVIKIISMFVGGVVFLRKHNKKGFLKGLILGFAYYILSYIIFSILQGGFSLSISNLYDLILTVLMGGLIGIIVVNAIKN
ncbi:MAG: TIGR04086 family membrane protein [Christensenellales bacterium]